MELWKEVPGYEGLYLVSDQGRVVGLNRGIQKPSIDAYGYYRTALCKDGEMKSFYVHRIVALAFIPNPLGKETVNHINENKLDNRAENLEWATTAEQNRFGTRTQRASQSQRDSQSRCKAVIQIDAQGNEYYWPSITAACDALGLVKGNIIKCCKGKSKSTGGFYWRYAE